MRTDIHAPSRMDPAEYEFVTVVVNKDPIGVWDQFVQDRIRAVRALRTDPMFRRAKKGGCKLCGQTNYNEGAIFKHLPTGELIELGWQCAEKMEFYLDYGAVEYVRAERKRLSMAFRERCDRRGRLREFVRQNPRLVIDLKVKHKIIQDIRKQAIRFFGLTPRQAELVHKLAFEAANPQPQAKKVPAPVTDERIEITGTILKVKFVKGLYGATEKMLVEVKNGDGVFRLWSTLPSAVYDALRDVPSPQDGWHRWLAGKQIRFFGKIEVSKDDPSFGFVKRPTKVVLL